MAKVREYDSEATIAAYLHRNDGEAYVKSYTAVNEDLKIDASKDSECISKVKVTMHVEEDKSVKKDGSFYEKRVGLTQERDGGQSHSASGRGSVAETTKNFSSEDPHYEKDSSPDPSPLAVLKNFVDNIAASQRLHTLLIVGAFIVAVTALVLAAVA